jgi:hypothetical protein
MCKAKVPIPRNAEQGDTITCPDCDEEFTPKVLQKGHYNPNEEETFAVGAAVADPEKAQKARKAKALMAQGRAERDNRFKSGPRPFFGGPEIVLLIFAAVFALALPAGYFVAKRFPSTGEGALIVFAYCGMMFFFGLKMIRRRKQIGG